VDGSGMVVATGQGEYSVRHTASCGHRQAKNSRNDKQNNGGEKQVFQSMPADRQKTEN